MTVPAVQDHLQTAQAAYASTEAAVSAFIATGPSLRSGLTHAARKGRSQAARRLDTTFGGQPGWGRAGLDVRLGAPVEVRGLVIWLGLATATPLDPRFVAGAEAGWGQRLTDLHPELAARFTQIANSLGFRDQQTRRQWAVLAKLVAVTGVPPEQLHRRVFNTARDLIGDALQAARGGLPNTWTTPLHGLQATLSALEILDTPDGKRVPDRGRPEHWEYLTARAPEMTATMPRYLTQLKISMRAGSVALIDTTLRHFAAYLTQHHRDIRQVRHVRRTHLEGFKVRLASRPGYRGRPHGPAKTTIGMRLGHLRCFFDRIIEWGYEDAPDRNPVFAGDMPIRDRPLPRFLDDPDATKLLSAARRLPALFDRVCVEVLARTGLRKGEFLGLTTDAVVTVGQGEWLRTPIGKLHNDRYIPLHPRVKTLLGQWLAQRGDQPSPLMFVDHGRRIPQTRVDAAVRRAAAEAGIGHVTPHQLPAHPCHPGDQPGNEPGSDRRTPRPHVDDHDHDLRQDRRSNPRRRILRRHREGRISLQHRPTCGRRRGPQHATPPRRDDPPATRQRLLRPARGARLPLRDHLRKPHVLHHHDPIPRPDRSPTRRRRPTPRHRP